MSFSFLKEFFAGFVRARHMGRHFRRLAMFEGLTRAEISRDVPANVTKLLIDSSLADSNALYRRFSSAPEGLTDAQAASIREAVGFNEVDHEKPLPWWVHLWYCYKNPFNLLLTLLAGVSYVTDDLKATVVISVMVVLSMARSARSTTRAGWRATTSMCLLKTPCE